MLRGGKVTGEVDPAQETNASLSRLMIGAEPPQLRHAESKAGAAVLTVDKLSLAQADPFAMPLDAVSFEVRAGEIVGIAGVSGNGQKELMAALSGRRLRVRRRDVHQHPRRQTPDRLRCAAQAPPRWG